MIYKIGLCASIKSNYFEVYLELMDLFTNHPDYPEILENVIDIAIVKNKLNLTYLELQIIREDNTVDNISYGCCINKPNIDRNLKNAMRHAIHSQTLQFRNECDVLECALCKSKDKIHIDHILLFKTLYDEFLRDKQDIPTNFDDNFYNSAVFKKEDIKCLKMNGSNIIWTTLY